MTKTLHTQVADALGISKNKPYRALKDISLYQWKSLLVGLTSTITIEEIRQTQLKGPATRSRRYITISVDDTKDMFIAKHIISQ